MGDNPPDQQRAWVNIGRGTPAKALVLRSDWPVSKKLRPGEVLVKVHAAALNPVQVPSSYCSALIYLYAVDTSFTSTCQIS